MSLNECNSFFGAAVNIDKRFSSKNHRAFEINIEIQNSTGNST